MTCLRTGVGLWMACAGTLLGCGGGGPVTEVSPSRQVVALAIDPGVDVIDTGPAGGDPIQFAVWAQYSGDSAWYPVEGAAWSLSNASVGTLSDDGLLTPTDQQGVTWVTAAYGGQEAQATVTVRYVDTWMLGGDPSLFDASPVETELKVAWYPSDNTAVPRNTDKIAFLVREPDPEDPPTAWELRITSELVDLTVYLDDDDWFPTPEQWARLTSTNSGIDLEWSARAANDHQEWTDVGGVRRLRIERFDARGTVYYWSSSVQGIKQAPYGETARDFISMNTTGDCIGCHAVSADGTLAFTWGSYDEVLIDDSVRTLALLDLETGQYRASHEDLIYSTYKTFSPDGSRLLTVSNGSMWVNDAATGERIAPIPTELPVTQPVWSPDGTEVVVVVIDGEWLDDYRFQGSYLAKMADLGDGSFGPLEPFYVPDAGATAFFPAWSPDGEWLAFVQSDEHQSHLPPDAGLMVVPAGGGEALHMAAASKDYSVNSWPHWAPLSDDDVMWLAFSAQRNYGDLSQDTLQIWIAGFEPARARQGVDPSWAAFWWPDQDAGEHNHLPFWLDAPPVDPPPVP